MSQLSLSVSAVSQCLSCLSASQISLSVSAVSQCLSCLSVSQLSLSVSAVSQLSLSVSAVSQCLGCVSAVSQCLGCLSVSRLCLGCLSVSRLCLGCLSVSRLCLGCLSVSRLSLSVSAVSQLSLSVSAVSQCLGCLSVSQLSLSVSAVSQCLGYLFAFRRLVRSWCLSCLSAAQLILSVSANHSVSDVPLNVLTIAYCLKLIFIVLDNFQSLCCLSVFQLLSASRLLSFSASWACWFRDHAVGLMPFPFTPSWLRQLFVCWLLACLTSQQHASVSQGRICSDNSTFCHTEIEAADQTFYLTQSQYTNTRPTCPNADPKTPGAWQGSHWRANFFLSHWYDSTGLQAQAGIEPRVFRSRGGRLNHWAKEAVPAASCPSWCIWARANRWCCSISVPDTTVNLLCRYR